MKSITLIVLTTFLLFVSSILHAQQDPKWDDTQKRAWPDPFKEISITSSADGKTQKAYFYASTDSKPQPLIISLHTWSGNYQQKDPLISQIIDKNWNYIRPDFRGPNYTPEACGSPLVVADIDDAIQFALDNAHVDPNNIHVMGASGGGYATLLTYMQSKHQISTFSAWAAISDISKWYYETKARGLKYAKHIALATAKDSANMDLQEAINRSPLYMETPVEKRQKSKLFIYTGVHDGYKGSVPISHSLEIYNKVVQDFQPSAVLDFVPSEVIHQLVTSRSLPHGNFGKIGKRKIHYRQQFEDKVSVTIFEGGHEMLSELALNHIPTQNILAIGDSNGAMKGGWVDQLKQLRSQDNIYNTAISGNTIGFDNLGSPLLNTLAQVEKHLKKYDPDGTHLDKILILLGTNDCKAEYDSRQDEVVKNYQNLLQKIKQHYTAENQPTIHIITPPPYGDDEMLIAKYKGAGQRVVMLKSAFEKLAQKNKVHFIDIHSPLQTVFPFITTDGVHLKPEGQKIIASIIDASLQALE